MQYLKDLFGYNARFADEVIKSLRTIDRARFIEEKVSAWGSLRNLVLHLIEAEDYWINKVVQGKEFKQYDFDDYFDIDAIEEKWKEIDGDIILFLEGITAEDLKKDRQVKWDKEYSYKLERILQHIYTHTAQTRGQIVAAIRALGGKVPYVDII
jgi:uncharacterized damage-inducible protein DinB